MHVLEVHARKPAYNISRVKKCAYFDAELYTIILSIITKI